MRVTNPNPNLDPNLHPNLDPNPNPNPNQCLGLLTAPRYLLAAPARPDNLLVLLEVTLALPNPNPNPDPNPNPNLGLAAELLQGLGDHRVHLGLLEHLKSVGRVRVRVSIWLGLG